MSHCKYAKLIRDGKTCYPLEEHQRDCDTCQADLEIEKLQQALIEHDNGQVRCLACERQTYDGQHILHKDDCLLQPKRADA